MISVSQALEAVVASVRRLPAESISLDLAGGRFLAADVTSDSDSPPFDKSLMDGYAVRAADVRSAPSVLSVVGELTAGRVWEGSVANGEVLRIMTGAPLPDGADAVVPVEQTRLDPHAGRVEISTAVERGANVLRQAASLRRGERVLPAGRLLRAQELGALAELGWHRVSVVRRPRVAVLATGDELVPVDTEPGPGQIRNSNETMLVAQIRQAGGEPVPLGIARDEPQQLCERIAAGLACDMLVLSGGVSAGRLDLVPAELAAAGVRQVFHKVDVKPGKPVWFGVLESDVKQGTVPDCRHGPESASHNQGLSSFSDARPVFGLPGNPVSSLVCFELFARTAIRRMLGVEPPLPSSLQARLAEDHIARGERPTYHPSSLSWTNDGPMVRLVRWMGSADLRATVDADAMAVIPGGDRTWPAGSLIDVILW